MTENRLENRASKLSRSSRLIHCLRGFGLLGRLDADEAAVTAFVFKLDVAGDESEERVVLALADVFAGLVLRAALAHENRACIDELPAEALYAQPLSVRIAAVCRGAAAFLMCHDEFPFSLEDFFENRSREISGWKETTA
jgi:hypothetical protein